MAPLSRQGSSLDGIVEEETVSLLRAALKASAQLPWRETAEKQERLARALFAAGDLDGASDACERARRLWQLNSEPALEARARAMTAVCRYKVGDLSGAEKLFIQARDAARAANEPELMLCCMQNEAVVQLQLGRPQNALAVLRHLLTMNEEVSMTAVSVAESSQLLVDPPT
jgi:tetratricopeptide (TPR) repeat protein